MSDTDTTVAPEAPSLADGSFVAAINQLSAEKAELAKQVTDLQRQLKSKTEYADGCSKREDDLRKELNQLHALLDGMAGAPPQVVKTTNNWGGTEEHQLAAMTRLAGWLASRVAQ